MGWLIMPDVLSFDWGVNLILLLQGFSPGLDLPFKLLSLLGNEGFYLFLLPLIYWCVDRRIGARLAVLFLVSAYLNSAVKILVAQPRPFHYDQRVRALVSAGGGGLPSGHTQHSVVVWGFLAMRSHRAWAWTLAAFLMMAIPLSRLYLGVHFPVDILGGFLLGALLLAAFVKLEPLVEAVLQQGGLAEKLSVALVFPAALVLSSPSGDPTCTAAGSALMGMGIGMILERRWIGFQTRGVWWKRLLRLVIGMAISVAIWAGLKSALASLEPESICRFLRYGLLGFWAALGAPWVFYKLGLVDVMRSRNRMGHLE